MVIGWQAAEELQVWILMLPRGLPVKSVHLVHCWLLASTERSWLSSWLDNQFTKLLNHTVFKSRLDCWPWLFTMSNTSSYLCLKIIGHLVNYIEALNCNMTIPSMLWFHKNSSEKGSEQNFLIVYVSENSVKRKKKKDPLIFFTDRWVRIVKTCFHQLVIEIKNLNRFRLVR